MTRDNHRAPSRLASSRPESSWKTHSTLPSEQNAVPARAGTLRDPSDYDLEHDIADGVPGVSPIRDTYDNTYESSYEPLSYDRVSEALPVHDELALGSQPSYEIGEIDEIGADEPYRPISVVRSGNGNGNGHKSHARASRISPYTPPVEPDYSRPALPPSAPPRVAVESEPASYDFTEERGELSPSDQYQLLLYNIQLYDDDWKLARIRGTAQDKWMRAYLIPRYRKMEWEEACQRGQLLQIAIDNAGNTVVREPKKPGLLRRLLNWLYGR